MSPLLAAAASSDGVLRIMLLGAGSFGLVIGWFVYYVNRHRKDDVQLSDVVTLIGAIGGAAVLSLFEAKSALFGAYGVGLALGFFGYFITLLLLVRASRRTTGNFDWEWFLDGRKKDPPPGTSIGPVPMSAPFNSPPLNSPPLNSPIPPPPPVR